MKESITIAKNAGIVEDKIMIDPGIGFAKTLSMNLDLMKHLEVMNQFGYPVLLGTSRKSMIGNTLNVPVDQRLEGTIATSVIGVMKGCHFVRVHDVLENQRAIRMTEAILGAE
jgi:dihydropteroate synthase